MISCSSLQHEGDLAYRDMKELAYSRNLASGVVAGLNEEGKLMSFTSLLSLVMS